MSIWDPYISYLVRREDFDGRTVIVRRKGREPVTVFVGEQAKMRQAPGGNPQPWESDGCHEILLTKPNAESYGLWPDLANRHKIGSAPEFPPAQ
jgi:hypothetical protein